MGKLKPIPEGNTEKKYWSSKCDWKLLDWHAEKSLKGTNVWSDCDKLDRENIAFTANTGLDKDLSRQLIKQMLPHPFGKFVKGKGNTWLYGQKYTQALSAN